MPPLKFREIKPLRFKELAPEPLPADLPRDIPDFGDLFQTRALTEPPAPIAGEPEADVQYPRRKGPGFLGTFERPGGDFSTELSIGVNIDGRETEIPTLVPGLTREEIDQLLTITDPQKIPKPIVDKAVKHARQRMGLGLSPFKDPDEDDEPGAVDYIKGRWRIGKAQAEIGLLRYRDIIGQATPEDLERIEQIKATMPRFVDEEGRSLPIRAIAQAAEFLPIMLATMQRGMERGLKLGAGAAAITGIAGVAGPQAALPEEVITVPAAFAGMYGVGMLSGTLEAIGQIEAGLAYDELLEVKDDEGNVIDPKIAKAAAGAVGVINGLIELGQINLLLRTIPGGRRILSGIIRDVTKDAVTSGALREVVRGAARLGAFVTAETAQEVLQETTNILAQDVATRLTNELEGTDLPKQTREQIVDRIVQTAKASALGFAALGLPGTTVTTAMDVARRAPLPDVPVEAPGFVEVTPAPPPEAEFVPTVTPEAIPPEAAPPERVEVPVEEIEEEPAPARIEEVELTFPEEPILTNAGTPFKTERGATQNIPKAQKLFPDVEEWAVVPVEDGFGLFPAGMALPEVEEAPELVREEVEGFRVGDTVQTPFGEGEITTMTATQAGVRMVDGTFEVVDFGDLSPPIAPEEAVEPVEAPAPEMEPEVPVEPEAPIEPPAAPVVEEVPEAVEEVPEIVEEPEEVVEAVEPDIVGKDSKDKDVRIGDTVAVPDRFPGKQLEIVRQHPSRPDIMKVRIVGQKRQYNVAAADITKVVRQPILPPKAQRPKIKTLIGWFRKNPIWDVSVGHEEFLFNQSGVGGLVNEERGLGWDELETAAKEDHILTEGQTWEDLQEMLRQEIGKRKAGKPPTPLESFTDLEKVLQAQSEAEEEAWIAEQANKVETVSMNVLELEVGDRVNVATPQGDSEWLEVTEVTEDGKVVLTDEVEAVWELFDWVDVVGGEAFGVDKAADRRRPDRIALRLEKDQEIPVLNSLEWKAINILNDDKKLNHVTIPIPTDQAKIIDKELWMSNEAQKRYGLHSKYDKVKWAIAMVKGDARGDRVYDVQRPYGYLTFDQKRNLLTVWPTYEETISASKVMQVQPDLDKERIVKTTIMRDVLNQQPNRTIPNELLQNAFDAMPPDRAWERKVMTYNVDGHYIDGVETTVVKFEDNGWGMTPDIFAFQYLKIGAKGKPSEVAKGGFGKANAALLYYPNRIKVITTAWAIENDKFPENDPRHWERGQSEETGEVNPDAIKVQVAMDATQDQMFDGLSGRKDLDIVVTEVDIDTPTGTYYEAHYDEKNERGYLKVPSRELQQGFQKYVQQVRDRAVIIEKGVAAEPDNVVHTKSFEDIEPEELKVPKITMATQGSEVEIYFLDTGTYGAWPIFGKYKIAQHFYNKGLPLQIPMDNIDDILRIPFEPDFKIFVNWIKTPEVDEDTYPFIKNRTEVLNDVGEDIAEAANEVIQDMIDKYMQGQLADFEQSMRQSLEFEGVKVFLPYRDPKDLKKAKALVNKNRGLFRKFAQVFNSFKEFLAETGQPTVDFVITVDPRLHGFKTNPDEVDQTIYAINPFSMTAEYLEKDSFKKAVAAGQDPLLLKGNNVATTLLHEYVHKFVKGHEESYTQKLDEVLTILDPVNLGFVGREGYEIYQKYDKRIEELEEAFQELGKGGLLIRTGSSLAFDKEHESGRVKGSSTEAPVAGTFAASRIQYDLFGDHQKIDTQEELPSSPEDFLKRSFPDATEAQIKAMLEDPKLRQQIAQGNISTEMAERIERKYNLAKSSATQREMFPESAKGQGDLFDLSRKDLGDHIEEHSTRLGKDAGVWILRGKSAKAEGKAFESSDDEVQARVEAARGVSPEAWKDLFNKKIKDLKRRATREFEHLAKTAEFAELRSALLRLQKQRGVVNRKTMRKLDEIDQELNKTDSIDFAWKVILDDLMEEVSLQRERGVQEDDIGLPYGYTPEVLERDFKALNRHIAPNVEIQKALQRRKAFWDNLRKDYIKAMKEIGFDVSKYLTREYYYRHQVLNYVNVMGLFGSGERLRTPSYRSHLRPRTGSSADINADYRQAEHEVVAQMLYDIEIARVINIVDRYYNIQDELKAQAMLSNDNKMLDFFEAMVRTLDVPPDKEPPTAEDLYRQILNKKMAIGFDKLGQLAAQGELPTGKNREWEWLVEELAENWYTNKEIKKDLGKEWTNADRIPLSDRASAAVAKYSAWVIKEHGGEPAAGAAATIFKGINEKRQIIQQTLGKEYVEWKDLIPEGYSTWQPWEGTTFFMAHSVPETIAKLLLEGELEKVGITADDLRKGLMRGGRRREYVVKNEVKDTLNAISTPKLRGPLGRGHAYVIRHWKIWQLVSPRRFGKYNFRNLTGDADAVFVGSPEIFKQVKPSFAELYEVFVRNQDPEKVNPELAEWLERGGWGATLQAQEMGEFKETDQFLKKFEKQGIMGIPNKAWKSYWKMARVSTDFREAVLRYAAYKQALRNMEESPDGLPKDYWASIPEEIQGLRDIRDRAYFLSNDLLGAYDRVSVMGQELRERWFPFWSWKAVNFMRYVQLFRNAANDGELTKKIGFKLAGTAVKSPFVAMRIGKFMLKAWALYALSFAINGLLFPREEEDLPDEIRGRPHIVFGRDSEGRVQYFPRIGAWADFLEWFGLDASPYYINQWLRGRMTLPEIAKDMAKSPFNVIWQGGMPFVKLIGETALERATFPDVFKPRTIRDRGLHIARSFGLENEYIALAGKPSRPYLESAPGVFIYTIDPFQASYRDIIDAKMRHMKKIGLGGTSFHLSDRGNALYNMRLALRYNDMPAAIKYMAEYLSHKGTLRGIKQSLNRMHPLGGLNDEEKLRFVASLDKRQLAQLVRAIKFWEELVLAATPEQKRDTRLRFKRQ